MSDEQITLRTDDVVSLLTGARAGAEHLARFGNQVDELSAAIHRVEDEVAARVSATLPGQVGEHVMVRAGLVMAALRDLTPTHRLPGSATTEQLAEETGLGQDQVEVCLAALRSQGQVATSELGGSTVWSLA